jgi:copper(I)-binding protein
VTATVRPSRGIGRSGRRLACVALVAALPLTACAAGYQAETSRVRTTLTSVAGAVGQLTLRNVFLVGPGQTGGNIPLYMAIFNGGVTDDKLVSVSAAGATGNHVPVDSTITTGTPRFWNDGDGDVPQLTGLTKNVLVGQTMDLKLVFENAGELDITVPVVTSQPDAQGSPQPGPSPLPSATPSATVTPSDTVSPSESASSTP